MFLAAATLKELAPPTFMDLVAQTLYFFDAALALSAIEVRPIEPAAMAKLAKKLRLLKPRNDCFGSGVLADEQLCDSVMI